MTHYAGYPKKYAHGFVVLCFVVVMQSFIMNSHEVFIIIHQGCFAGTGEIVRLPQCQWSKPDGYGKISQCITTTKHSKAKTVCIFLGIYCNVHSWEDRYNTGTFLSVLTWVGMHHYVIYHDIISRGSVCITYHISMPVHDWWRTEDAEKSSISYWIKKTVGIWADAIWLICHVFQAITLGCESTRDLKTIDQSNW